MESELIPTSAHFPEAPRRRQCLADRMRLGALCEAMRSFPAPPSEERALMQEVQRWEDFVQTMAAVHSRRSRKASFQRKLTGLCMSQICATEWSEAQLREGKIAWLRYEATFVGLYCLRVARLSARADLNLYWALFLSFLGLSVLTALVREKDRLDYDPIIVYRMRQSLLYSTRHIDRYWKPKIARARREFLWLLLGNLVVTVAFSAVTVAIRSPVFGICFAHFNAIPGAKQVWRKWREMRTLKKKWQRSVAQRHSTPPHYCRHYLARSVGLSYPGRTPGFVPVSFCRCGKAIHMPPKHSARIAAAKRISYRGMA